MHALGGVHVRVVELGCVGDFGFGGWVDDRSFLHQVLDDQACADQVADLVRDHHFGDGDQLVAVFDFWLGIAECVFFFLGRFFAAIGFGFVSIRVEAIVVDISFVSLLRSGVVSITLATQSSVRIHRYIFVG